MTAEIVNLNKVRKARERAVRERDAQENRLKYGQSKADRNIFEAKQRKSQADLEGTRRQSDRLGGDDDFRARPRIVMRPEKRSFSIQGHRTSISLETAFWAALKNAAAENGQTLASLINAIDKERGDTGLSSAVRVWLLKRLQAKAEEKLAP